MQTPSQTVGPYFAYGLTPEQYRYDFTSWADGQLIGPDEAADAITITGKVFDGEGAPIPDALIEVWQDDGLKQRFGRFGTGTDPDKQFIFQTIKPAGSGGQAPFLTVLVFMRGQLIHSLTRMYFPDEAPLNDRDEVLQSVPANRRHTLIATQKGRGYVFDIRMQGENETVFFEI